MSRNCIKNKVIFIVALLLTVSSLYSAELTIGGKEGWPSFLHSYNVTKGKGRFGYDAIEVATNSLKSDDFTDLLIDFENINNPISYGDYEIVTNSFKYTDQTINDKGAGLSRNTGGMSIKGNPGTFFGSEGLNGSFTIEFWLCPSISENGETIIEWDTSKNVVKI